MLRDGGRTSQGGADPPAETWEAVLPLHCRVVGDPSGRPTVLLHALGETGASWDRLASELAVRGRRLYVPDLRGHGRSPRSAGYSFAALYADVVALLDAHELSGIDVVGHSMGGHVGWLLAQRQPARVRRLVIEDTPPPPRDAAAEAELAARSGGDGSRAQVLALYREFRALRRSGELDAAAVRPIIDELRRADEQWWRRLADVTAQTLVISGGLSSPVPRPLLAEVAARVPHGRMVAVDAGHYVHREEPERFDAEVLAFLA
ncbi:alpha/beta hydrolase [Streptomyces sp. NPDC048057]|uniref:alpha/beta fold hydrolase n=1 Tax=Streptomyces sp. NPDC048057 TaxID=3155628 RepID=UPI00340C8634